MRIDGGGSSKVSHLTGVGVTCSRGNLVFGSLQQKMSGLTGGPFGWRHFQMQPLRAVIFPNAPGERAYFSFGGLEIWGLNFSDRASSGVIRDVHVRLWLFLPFAIPPILWLRRWRRRATRGFPVEVTASTEIRGSHGSTCSLLAVTKATTTTTKG